MKDNLWTGLLVFTLILAWQLVQQRKERPAARWLGGGLIVLGAAIWTYAKVAAPDLQPAGWLVLWLEPFVPVP